MAGQLLLQIAGSSLTVIPSIPGLPLLAFTLCNARFRFSSHILPPSARSVLAGFSGASLAENDSVASPPAAPRASPSARMEVQFIFWMFCRMSSLRSHVLLASPLVRAFDPFPARPICCSTFRFRSASISLPTT